MNNHYVHLRHISPLIKRLTGLPFGIVDDDGILTIKLMQEIRCIHTENENTNKVLQGLVDVSTIILNNRKGLSELHETEFSDIRVFQQLSNVKSCMGYSIQILLMETRTGLNDASWIRHALPPLVLTLNEEHTQWKDIALLDERRELNEELRPLIASEKQILHNTVTSCHVPKLVIFEEGYFDSNMVSVN